MCVKQSEISLGSEGEEHVFQLRVSSATAQRLDVYCSRALAETDLTREKIKELIKDGKVAVNGRPCTRPSAKVNEADQIKLAFRLPRTTIAPHEAPLDVLYRDADLLVVNKPAGLTVHPAPSCQEPTLVHRLLHHFPELAGLDTERPGIVHRLDKDTSGLLLVALNQRTRLALAEDFAARRVHKEYLALVYGVPARRGECRLPIGRHPTKKVLMAVVPKGGKEARTEYELVYADAESNWSLVRVRIHTGRTHQIRVHLSHLGHPIIGDALYARKTALPQARFPRLARLAPRQLLHAWRLQFVHPGQEKPQAFCCPPPKDFLRCALYVSRRTQRMVLTGMPGCGKSTVLRVFQEQGVPTISADAVVAQLYEPGEDGWEFVKKRFGETFLLTGGADTSKAPVDKRKLFQAMQTTGTIRDEVAAAIHPMVRHRLECFWEANSGARLAVAEIPLVLETGWGDNGGDIIAGVFCPRGVRLKRLKEHRGWDADMVATMDSWQWPEDKKIRACQLVLDNSGSLDELQLRTLGLLETLRFLRRSRARRFAARLSAFFEQSAAVV